MRRTPPSMSSEADRWTADIARLERLVREAEAGGDAAAIEAAKQSLAEVKALAAKARAQ